ncbi:hypothetical protein AAFF_G00126990 [Aldrovandia affinis]|uniref:Uncharacterized protein n=1 Tax=Aldrovandia affinis TaxID=143900 RepID=A0AAD7WXA2_9TELE|nr:hypothetical protein AAFF_G00126990 [Aldrovandia affinis]
MWSTGYGKASAQEGGRDGYTNTALELRHGGDRTALRAIPDPSRSVSPLRRGPLSLFMQGISDCVPNSERFSRTGPHSKAAASPPCVALWV